jgi:flagellar basal-body rod protein FlgB
MKIIFYLVFTIWFAVTNNVLAAANNKLNLKLSAKKTMAYTMKRQEIIAENLSSQDVPGYHSKDLKPLDLGWKKSPSMSLKTTLPGHISFKSNKNTNFKIKQDPYDTKTSKMNNNVDIPTQMVKASENMNQYNLSSTIYKQITKLQKISLGDHL